MADKTEKTEFEQLAGLLIRHGVEFVVIGGQAEVLHGGARVTLDVDICYRRTRENLACLAAALKEMGATLRGAPEGLPFILDARTLEMGANFTFDTKIIAFDILGFVEPLGGFDAVRANAILYKSHDLELWTISLDDLLKVKLHINRPKDQESIAQLKAIKRVRDESKDE